MGLHLKVITNKTQRQNVSRLLFSRPSVVSSIGNSLQKKGKFIEVKDFAKEFNAE
jgi:hypothetical protein